MPQEESWIDALLRKMGVGTYTTADGRVMTDNDLTPEQQQQLRSEGGMRDLARMAGDDDVVAKQQQIINNIYKNQDFEQGSAGAMDELLGQLQNRLRKKGVASTRGQ